MQKVIIDRFEENLVICENEGQNIIELKKECVPKEAREGDVLIIDDENKITIDYEEKEERKKRILELQEKLFR